MSTLSIPISSAPALDISKEQLLLPWDRFSYWLNSILVVTFDIEMGQSLEAIYPSPQHVKLTQNEKANICYMSFPDSNSGFLGDTQHYFRIKQDSLNTPITTNSHSNMKSHVYEDYNYKSLNSLEVDQTHLFGYVYFRQIKDKTLKRGYFQKSVVLLSKFPFNSLFSQLVGLIAREYFTSGGEVIETACHDIDQWALPVPGEFLSLPLLGNLIEISFPLKFDKYQLPVIYKKETPSIPTTLPPVHEVNLYKSLEPILVHIHLLWELILLNESIVVIASSPSVCSETVQALISCIWPLKYSADYRPFFTIHNSEFAHFSNKHSSPPSLIIGVTNPFFCKVLQHWPNIIKVADVSKQTVPPCNQNAIEEITNKALNSLNSSFNKSSIAKIKKTSSIRVVDNKPAVYTHYESYLSKNKEILKNLIRGAETNRPSEAQSAILRRHFLELTQSFIIPLERYFSSLMPLHKNLSPFKSVPKLKQFDVEEFMQNLKQGGPDLMPKNSKGDWCGLYRRFFNSLNFKHWYEQKKQEADRKLESLQLNLLCEYDIEKWLVSKHEIEIIDQFMNVKKKLDLAERNKIDSTESAKTKLRDILDKFLKALPEDVRAILHK